MSEVSLEKSEKALEPKSMSTLAEASFLLRQIAGAECPGEGKKAALGRAFMRLSGGMSFNRVADLWREERRASVKADEMELLRRTAAKYQSEAKRHVDELASLKRRIDALEHTLLQMDEAFYRPQVDALRSALRGVGGAD